MLSEIELLPQDCLEVMGCYLDCQSALNILRASKTLHQTLIGCGRFWQHICKLQGLDEYKVLKQEESDSSEKDNINFFGKKLQHLDWDDENPPLWRRIYLRGVSMKRNISVPSYKLSRLYLTDKDNLPVKELRKDTGDRELRKMHRRSKAFKRSRHRGRGERYWTEDYFVSMQGRSSRSFYEVFVWRWESGRNIEFMYSIDLVHMYPGGLFPTTFYIWKDYFVTLPLDPMRDMETCIHNRTRCILRVHDLRSNLKVVSEFNLPPDTVFVKPPGEIPDTFQLVPMDQEDPDSDKCVVLLRTDQIRVYVFSVPSATMLFSAAVPVLTELNSRDVIDQTKAAQHGVLYFWLQRMEGLFGEEEEEAHDQDGPPIDNFSRLLQVDCRQFAETGQPVFRICQQFEHRQGIMESISFISSDNQDGSKSEDILSVNKDGWVLWREIMCMDTSLLILTKRQIPIDDYIKEDVDDDFETEAPSLEFNKQNNLIIVFRHLTSGRKIHAYDKDDNLVYMINIDDKAYGLTSKANYLSIDVFRNFVGVADRDRIVIFEAASGDYCSTIHIPKHYDYREDPVESEDKYAWKGNEISFSEDGIIVNHNHWDYPATADVILFW